MSKLSCAVVIGAVAIASFFLGVKCSDSVKNHASWMFEGKDDVALPDLSNEEIEGTSVGEDQDILTNTNAASQNSGEVIAPMEETAPAKSAPTKK